MTIKLRPLWQDTKEKMVNAAKRAQFVLLKIK